ncbi:T9SS type A sorting domain-containing protein, partial [bacterium]|nr:T9SS type A sorting domain-containing protein [bacterium]
GYVNPNKGEWLTIHFDAAHAGTVKVKIYTLRGQSVWKTSKETDGEEDFITWNCKNTEGTVVASGVYVIHIDGPGIKDIRRAVVLK